MTQGNFDGVVFRFRSTRSVLDGSSELEKQTIHLSPPLKLNDPLEGYQDVFWTGDAILWENLLRHYVLSLLWCQSYCLIADDDSFEDHALQVGLTRADLPTDQYRSTYEGACDRFFANPDMADLPDLLSKLSRPLRTHGLQAVLTMVHRTALGAVHDELEARKILPKGAISETPPPSSEAFRQVIAALNDDSLDESKMESFLAGIVSFSEGPILERLAATEAADEIRALKKYNFLVASFPRRYVRQICDTLIHTNWQTACFTKSCTNPAVWAAYGDGHRGVALMFKVEDRGQGSPRILPVRGTTGWRESKDGAIPIEGDIRLAVQDVDYNNRPPQIDFFRYLGTLPRNKLLDTWHVDRNGNKSPLVDEILADEDLWRQELWKRFQAKSTTKMPTWGHEEECRVVMSDLFNSHVDGRTVTFQLDQLAGVVFGLRTSLKDKVAIAKILSRKCGPANREMVPLYQMVFDGAEMRLVPIVMGRSNKSLHPTASGGG